eukprot:4968720-Ditylum_brightwellii.AAC.1
MSLPLTEPPAQMLAILLPYVQHVAVAADSVAPGTFSGVGALSSSTSNPMPQICWIISPQSKPKF